MEIHGRYFEPEEQTHYVYGPGFSVRTLPTGWVQLQKDRCAVQSVSEGLWMAGGMVYLPPGSDVMQTAERGDSYVSTSIRAAREWTHEEVLAAHDYWVRGWKLEGQIANLLRIPRGTWTNVYTGDSYAQDLAGVFACGLCDHGDSIAIRVATESHHEGRKLQGYTWSYVDLPSRVAKVVTRCNLGGDPMGIGWADPDTVPALTDEEYARIERDIRAIECGPFWCYYVHGLVPHPPKYGPQAAT